MPNKLKTLWSQGKPTVNGWLAIPSGFSAEVMAQAGFDSVTVDSAARGAGLSVDGPLLPGDAGASGAADGAGAVERAGDHRQGAGCGGLWRDLPDDQHEGRGGEAGELHAVSTQGGAQQRADPGGHLWRQHGVSEHGERRDPVHADDRDAAGDRQSGRHPGRAWHRCGVYRAERPGVQPRRVRPRWIRRRRRRWTPTRSS